MEKKKLKCYHCDNWKPPFEFHFHRTHIANYRGRRQGVCKECMREYYIVYEKKKRAWDRWNKEREYWEERGLRYCAPEPPKPQPMRKETHNGIH